MDFVATFVNKVVCPNGSLVTYTEYINEIEEKIVNDFGTLNVQLGALFE